MGDIDNRGGRLTAPVARAEQVHRYFRTPDGTLEVLKGIELTVDSGRMVAIVGASGVGKSTLLHVLGGLDPPTKGRVFWGGISPYELDDETRARKRNRMVGFVFQFHHLLPEFTALENVALPLIIGGLDMKVALDRARTVLDEVGLAQRGSHRPGEMSGGEQQRAAVARALVTEAPLVIADEPSGNLDRRTAEQLHELLCYAVREKGRALVVATHNPDLAGRADSVLVMRDGLIQAVAMERWEPGWTGRGADFS
jgi:lipoprotein-releasing system ATP-binding protein